MYNLMLIVLAEERFISKEAPVEDMEARLRRHKLRRRQGREDVFAMAPRLR